MSSWSCPHEVYLPLDRLLDELKAAGLVGILSHPERNRGILQRPEVVRPLVAAGCLTQITADSLTGLFGNRVQRLAKWLILEGLAHCVSTDAHGMRARLPVLKPAFAQVVTLVGHSAAVELFSGNPGRVFAGRSVAPQSQSTKPSGWGGWFRWKKAG